MSNSALQLAQIGKCLLVALGRDGNIEAVVRVLNCSVK